MSLRCVMLATALAVVVSPPERRPALIFVHGALVARQAGRPPTTWPYS